MIEISRFVFNPFQENTYILYDDTKTCIIVDPGCYEKYEQKELKDFIEGNSLTVKYLVNTHCHIDHVLGNAFVKNTFSVPLLIHRSDEPVLNSVKAYAPNYGFNLYEEAQPDQYLKEGDSIEFGNSLLEVLFVPGHAPGHIALINKPQNICIGGDVLFRESVGRTDLPGGDHQTLIESIQNKLFPLSDDMIVYPGHGPQTTIGHEKKFNPFCHL